MTMRKDWSVIALTSFSLVLGEIVVNAVIVILVVGKKRSEKVKIIKAHKRIKINLGFFTTYLAFQSVRFKLKKTNGHKYVTDLLYYGKAVTKVR